LTDEAVINKFNFIEQIFWSLRIEVFGTLLIRLKTLVSGQTVDF